MIGATYCGASGRGRRAPPSTRPAAADEIRPLARAEERFRQRQEELSRQIDEYYGTNGERPEPVGPQPVSGGALRGRGPGTERQFVGRGEDLAETKGCGGATTLTRPSATLSRWERGYVL